MLSTEGDDFAGYLVQELCFYVDNQSGWTRNIALLADCKSNLLFSVIMGETITMITVIPKIY